MIQSKSDYLYYLTEDQKALGIVNDSFADNRNPYHIDREIWLFQKALRRCEFYFLPKHKGIIWQVRKLWAAYIFKKRSLQINFTIPPYVFGPGLRIAHRGTIVVHARCRIGSYCTINAGVNIGTKAGFQDLVPKIGNHVYIGPGAKIFGKIHIPDGCAIGANSVICKDVAEENSILLGIPAITKGKVTRKLQV